MTELLNVAAPIVIPMAALTGALCIADGISYLWDVCNGYTRAPRWWTRRYWHGVLCRVVCRLAELEAAWEKRKIPRKAATSHGIVGQRVRKAEYGYIKIVPQPDPRVKGLQIEKSYRR